jgi:hypothetical protein
MKKAVRVLIEEAGEWLPWRQGSIAEGAVHYRTVHAIEFEDGSVWDAHNGWRPETTIA